MKTRYTSLLLAALLTTGLSNCFTADAQTTAQANGDPGWPRVFDKGGKQLTIYQPQVDYWNGYTNLHIRCAISVKGVTQKEQFGVAEIDAATVVDHNERTVELIPVQREVRFPNTSESEEALLRSTVNELKPPGQAITVSLDRVLAYLDREKQSQQRPVDLNLNPPKIFYSSRPAILVIFMGEPQFKPVETNRTDLLFALDTNWDLFYDTTSQRYFLRNQNTWLSAPDVEGPWTAAQTLPASLSTLPDTENWADVRQNIPGAIATNTPTVFVSTEPAEMILTKGDPTYNPIPETHLMRVSNTDSILFMNTEDKNYFFLVAGRWFRANTLNGPWAAASTDLPADFARIPDDDPSAFVKASVPGTEEAKDAVLLASVPTSTTVNITNPPVQVAYNGQPQFKPIENTTVQYAANTPYSVFLVNGQYYCCDQGVWFVSSAPTGPWAYAKSVPPDIYTIPPTSPHYNVTYVTVQSSTPTTVVYNQTAGYSGEYVAATGVLMFGAGMLLGAALHDHDDYYYPMPGYYSYGCGAVYHYGYGGYYSGARPYYGPYGGAGYATAYNPRTGTYARGSYAYGPYGSASVRQAYNPYTGSYGQVAKVNTAYGSAARAAGFNPYTGSAAAGSRVSTPYGTASRGAAYNAQTGTRAAGAQVSTAAGSASRGAAYNPRTGNAAWGGSRSSAYGSAGAVKTSQGGGAAAWNTAQGQGAVAKGPGDNYYAAKDGNVYKRNGAGDWSQNTGKGWQSASRASSTSSLESQAQSRQRGNMQSERAQSFRSSGGGGGGRSFGGGGGGGRRR